MIRVIPMATAFQIADPARKLMQPKSRAPLGKACPYDLIADRRAIAEFEQGGYHEW